MSPDHSTRSHPATRLPRQKPVPAQAQSVGAQTVVVAPVKPASSISRELILRLIEMIKQV